MGQAGSPCNATDCMSCASSDSCGLASCDEQLAACQADQSCAALGGCIESCASSDLGCQVECVESYHEGCFAFYHLVDCAACSEPCTDLCDLTCSSCATEAETCIECVEGDCAANACQEIAQACIEDQDCVAYNVCVAGCDAGSCVETCAAEHPGGKELNDDWSVCLGCMQWTCWDLCGGDICI